MAGLEAIASFYVTDGLDTTIQFGSSAKPIPDTYAGLHLRCSIRGDDRNNTAQLRIDPNAAGYSGTNSHHQIEGVSGSGPTGLRDGGTSSVVFRYVHNRYSSDSFSYSPYVLDIMGYQHANSYTTFLYRAGTASIRGDQYEHSYNAIGSGTWKVAARMTHFTLDCYQDSEGFRRGSSFHLYGYGTS